MGNNSGKGQPYQQNQGQKNPNQQQQQQQQKQRPGQTNQGPMQGGRPAPATNEWNKYKDKDKDK